MKKIMLLTLVLLSLTIIGTHDMQGQCAMCGATVQSAGEEEGMIAGLNKGILYLLAIPYLIVMGFAVVIVRSIRRKKQVEQTAYIQN